MIASASIRNKFTIAFSLLIVIFMAVAGTALFSFYKLNDADNWNTHTHNVLDRSSRLIAAIVDQETGVRGFLVSGDEQFLEPYHIGKKVFAAELSKLLSLTSDNPEQQSRLRKIGEGSDLWHEKIVDPEIALGSVPETLEDARAIEASGAGKAFMDGIRVAHAEFVTAERALLVTRSATKQNTMLLAVGVLIGGSLITVLFALAMGWMLNRNIGHAIMDMTGTMTKLANGDNSVAVPHIDRKDEIGSMAEAVRVFKENAIQNAKLVEEQESTKARTEAERQRAQDEAIQSERQTVLQSFGVALSNIASKNLQYRIVDQVPGAYEELKDNFNNAIENLESALIQIGHNADVIRGGAGEIRSASDELSRRTEQQAASVEETAAAVEQITATVKSTADRAKEAGSLVGNTRASAESSGVVVKNAVEAMGEIKTSSEQIANIIGVIDDIAFQTNLLALNAGVEAARAGEAGKGFAVVAQEVRELAQRSATAAQEIKELITSSGNQVLNGVKLVDQTGEALEKIFGSVGEVATLVSAIVEATDQQSVGLQEINQAINTIDQGTQQNAGMVEETTAASHNLNSEVDSLSALLTTFKTEGAKPKASDSAKRDIAAVPTAVHKPAAPVQARVPQSHGNAAVDVDNWSEF